MDIADPFVAALTVALTWAARRYSSGKLEAWLVRLTPIAAVLIAVGLRAAVESAQGLPLSWSTVTHAAQAGVSAVFAHTALRSLLKAAEEPTDAE